MKFPDIAACAGAWSRAGVLGGTTSPACARAAGNHGANAGGTGCNVADLCAAGWHVCEDSTDVDWSLPLGGTCGEALSAPGQFYLARQATAAFTDDCRTTGSNNVFGCGNVGAKAGSVWCEPLDRYLTADDCGSLPGWECGPDDNSEASSIVHREGPGGVLCCTD